jgi:diguanylate cyclase (GGDEF)-like protein/PAS domain S-box-containing protein
MEVIMAKKVIKTNHEIVENNVAGEISYFNKENLSKVLKLVHLGPWNYNFKTNLFEFNNDFYALYGTDVAHEGSFMSPATYLREFVHPDDIHIVEPYLPKTLALQNTDFYVHLEHRIIRRDGAIRTLVAHINFVKDSADKNVKWYGINQDITEYKKMADDILVSKEKLSLAAELAHLAPWNYNLETNLFEFDNEFYNVYGTDVAHEGLTMAPDIYAREFVHPDDDWIVQAELDKVFLSTEREYSAQLEHRIIRRDGEMRTIAVRIKVIKDAAGKIIKFYGANQDITISKQFEEELKLKNQELYRINQKLQQEVLERVQTEKQLKYLSFNDTLTGLFNRSFFAEEMQRLSSGKFSPISIVIADVDGLKLVNDKLGHQAGDRLLWRTAEFLRCCFREGDVIARVGGDEFAAILPLTDIDVIERIVERIDLKLKNNTDPDIPLLISIGFATSKDPAFNLEELYHQADRNMYLDKEKHRHSSLIRLEAFLKKI